MSKHDLVAEGQFVLYDCDSEELETTKVFDSYLAATEGIDARLTNILVVRLPLDGECESGETDLSAGGALDLPHCPTSPNGIHVADPASATAADGAGHNRGTDWLIDFTCRHCGRSGATRIAPADIRWG